MLTSVKLLSSLCAVCLLLQVSLVHRSLKRGQHVYLVSGLNQGVHTAYEHFDVVVYGDELQGICAAVWAKRLLGEQGQVALVRSQPPDAALGGLLTRGGLSYLDLDKLPDWQSQPYAQCFREFIERSGVARTCIVPENAHHIAKTMLSEAGVTLISGATLTPHVAEGTIQYADIEQTKVRLYAANFIDATQNAELARKAGLAYYQGFESQRADLYNETLAVSVVPVTIGITIQDFQEIERQIFQNPELMSALETRVRDYQPPEGANFWLSRFREPIIHLYPDGFAVRSVALGAAYLLYRNQPFTLDGFFFDRSNVCAVGQPDVLSWNGFLFKYPVDRILEIEAQGYRPTPDMIAEMTAFEGWLQEVTGREVRVVLPPEVYVRHSVSIQDVLDPLTGLEIARGGTPPATSVGSFSYEFDFRGGVTGIGVAVPPLPAFNFGIESAQAANIDNLGIIGRASGYRGVAVAVGRIQTLNVYQGQAIGVAAAIASRAGVPLNTIPSAEVRQTLEQMTGLTTVLHGKNTMDGKDYGIQ